MLYIYVFLMIFLGPISFYVFSYDFFMIIFSSPDCTDPPCPLIAKFCLSTASTSSSCLHTQLPVKICVDKQNLSTFSGVVSTTFCRSLPVSRGTGLLASTVPCYVILGGYTPILNHYTWGNPPGLMVAWQVLSADERPDRICCSADPIL